MSKSNVTSTDQSAVEKSDKGAKTDPLCHNDKGSENETLWWKKQRSKRQEKEKSYEHKKVAKFMLKEREGIKEEHISILHEINLHKVVALIVMHCQTVNKVQRKDRQIQTGSTWCPRRT